MDGKSCPGEKICTTDCEKGDIAGLHGQLEKRTLENFCHNKIATKDNGLKSGCPLYDTKPENVPASLHGAIEAAETLRRYKQRGTLPVISELTAWEYCCFDTAEEASDSVEAEFMKKTTSNSTDNTTTKTGEKSPLGASGQTEEGGAFAGWGNK